MKTYLEKQRRQNINDLFDVGMWDRREDTIETLNELLELSRSEIRVPGNPTFEELYHLSTEWLSRLSDEESSKIEKKLLDRMEKTAEHYNL